MVRCWEKYISKVHNAVALDPWASDVQLLDILIRRRSSWLPWRSSKVRVGSMLTVGVKDATTVWKEKVEEPITTGLDTLETEEQTMKSNALPASGELDMHLFRVESMADIQASIKSSTSLLASITGGGSSEARLDITGAMAVNLTIAGVKSRRVTLETVMKMVSKDGLTEEPHWRPDISQPQLKWSSQRGQALWVITEIIYANKIKIKAMNKGKGQGKITVTTALPKVGEVDASTHMEEEERGVWSVEAAKDKSSFPFAFRMTKLRYDAMGTLNEVNPCC